MFPIPTIPILELYYEQY